jgi:hypothetical protein
MRRPRIDRNEGAFIDGLALIKELVKTSVYPPTLLLNRGRTRRRIRRFAFESARLL